MQGRQHPIRVRVIAIALTLAMHGLFLLLLWIEDRSPRREIRPLPQEINAWILLPPLSPAAEPEDESAQPSSPRPAAPPRSSTPARAPMRAITLPPTADSPASAESSATPVPDIDWRAEAAKRTAGYGEDEQERTGVGEPLPRLREPCKPPERSFKWKAEQEATSKGGSGSLTLGWIPNPPDDGFFDDMRAGKTPKSSVPSPHTCD